MRALPAGAGGVNRICFQSPADCGCSLDRCDYHRGRRSLRGAMEDRPVPIAFESKNQLSLSDNRNKVISQDSGETYMLFDLLEDPGETRD